MTNVFNVFTLMQIFNLVNSRKIFDEKNIFQDIFKNWMFCGILIGIIGAQILIVQVGSTAMKVSEGGLPIEHWIIAFLCGLSTWIAAFFIKFIPDTICP